MRILVLGSGGREHALVWKLSQSTSVEKIFLAPGNGGSYQEQKVTNVDLSIADFPALVRFAADNEVGLVIPGPEQPLVDGVESHFRKVGIHVFGPSQKAARMEGSKAFSKAFMQRHSIPTAKFRVFRADQFDEAISHVKTCGFKVVLKASGLAAGKGVLIPASTDEAVAGLREIMVDNVFGDAGSQVVIEELLEGPELSVLAFCDGYTIIPLPAAQDHKRIGEGDTGPNTGGMGAYAPAPIATPALMDRILKEALKPTIDGMRKEGFPFVGILFTGFMVTEDGPKVLEYNVRFGDPETEALMLLLSEDTDIAEVALACTEHRLDSVNFKTKPGFAVSVVLASQGYPGSYPKGKQITIGSVPSNAVVFHAGTTQSDDKIVTSGGRVLAVSAHAETLQAALDVAYSTVDKIQFDGKTYRRDIGHRALRSALGETKSLTYAGAGVSIDAGNSLVQRIKPSVRRTQRTGSNAEIGGFGGVFDLKATGYQDPVLISGTDGVGTKLHVAVEAGIHGTVGIDLVAMSVNDLIVQGAEPLYFLDYFACGNLDVEQATCVINGIADGCIQSGCALIGGETAEMPGMYKKGDYDLAGFAVGAVERSLILPRLDISAGDILLGLPSSGVHSNGFSLVRKIISMSGLDYSSTCPWDSSVTLGKALLAPTKIYVKTLLPVIRKGLLKGLSHVTGGGFLENIPRILPTGTGCYVDAGAWELPAVFKWLMKEGRVQPLEMARTFNNGIGMILIVSPDNMDEVIQVIQASGEQACRIGEVVAGEGVEMRRLEAWSS